MQTFTNITQAVYYTLRKELGRENKKTPKVTGLASFFKKLRKEQDTYNKHNAPKAVRKVNPKPKAVKKLAEIADDITELCEI